MYRLKSRDVYASEIADFLAGPLHGPDFVVRGPTSHLRPTDGTFCFLPRSEPVNTDALRSAHGVLVLSADAITPPMERCAWILTSDPEMAFIRVVDEFFIELTPSGVAATARVESGASIGLGVCIGEHSVVGSEAAIGNGTRIMNGVVIAGRVEIGRNCVIKNNATIGSQAFSFAVDAAGVPLLRPHIGRIVLGDNVWIGAGTCVENPALDETSIGNSTKIDDLVQIGHDCRIGERCLVTAGVILSHHVHIGEGTHIGPNACVRENVRIGQRAVVGIGAVVLKDIEDGSTYVGNPARRIRPTRA